MSIICGIDGNRRDKETQDTVKLDRLLLRGRQACRLFHAQPRSPGYDKSTELASLNEVGWGTTQ
ncbi:MAG: hypothetical protein AABO41_01245 [Acidobacteriota bacterium]